MISILPCHSIFLQQAQFLTEVSIAEYTKVEKLLPELHHYLRLDSLDSRLVEILQQLLPNKESELNPHNQLMLYNLGECYCILPIAVCITKLTNVQRKVCMICSWLLS